MKRAIVVLAFVLVMTLIVLPLEGKAQRGPGMMGPGGYGGWYCPYCGQHMGPYGGYGMGPGMMGPSMRWHGPMMGPGYGGYMMGPGHPGYGPQYGPPQAPYYQQPREPLKEGDVKGMLENYLRSTRNPNLKLGKIKEEDTHFEAEIVTKDGSLVDKILVDKNTGWMRSMYY